MTIDLEQFVSDYCALDAPKPTAKEIAEAYAERVVDGTASDDEFDTVVKNTIPQVEYLLE